MGTLTAPLRVCEIRDGPERAAFCKHGHAVAFAMAHLVETGATFRTRSSKPAAASPVHCLSCLNLKTSLSGRLNDHLQHSTSVCGLEFSIAGRSDAESDD